MYISEDSLISSLKDLSSLHPFFGITYLVCKEGNIPIGDTVEFSINAAETEFLTKYYKPVKNTEKFFRVFRISEKNKYWLNSDYASSGSQANRTQMFGDAFLHPKNSTQWGWTNDYLSVLQSKLNSKKIPAFSLAFWILKDFRWEENIDITEVWETFVRSFNISEQEILDLFDTRIPQWLNTEKFWVNQIYNWNEISNSLKITTPSDIPLEKGAALVSLELKNIQPYKNFKLDLSSRLNIITGDNGLGKSFVLECAWWALTGTWTGFPIYPRGDFSKQNPIISFDISSKEGLNESFQATYNWKYQDWRLNKKDKKTVPGLVIYAQVDGAFAIWDPARFNLDNEKDTVGLPTTMVFSREDIWQGLRIEDRNRSRSIFNGLITDWVHWQNSEPEIFNILKKVLKRLSPPDLDHGDLGILEPGKVVRIPGESRPMPTIKHPYGEIPVVFASAAVKRIVALAYLIVWTWEEHKTSAKLMHEDPQSKMVVIADEIESHLHPQWQRVILPALTSVSSDLSSILDIQFIITTHSPLVMASIEPIFKPSTDTIFHLNLKTGKDENVNVVIDVPIFEKGEPLILG
ncbi:AAA family ATPase [Dyadobacter sp. CY356]|uniref:AAA family ATPase n=1 Tax=Dyadobacter sp. CY356 TaxID=2906442 RepID=UPI001F1663D2|nr:AAA family ATPase [Dyadobacter sp. CY356]MCF0056853.1 AAA family ATPase [Dyadobacter sp. CY356]